MAKLILVEDNQELADSVVSWLKGENHAVDHAGNGADALHYLSISTYDLVILDWELPDIQGIDICRSLREKQPSPHILMLTGRNTIKDKTTGLDTGADDYLCKPFDLQELSARIRALLRRDESNSETKLQFSDITIETQSRLVWVGSKSVKLLRQEFDVLHLLVSNPSRYYSASMLLSLVWNDSSMDDEIVFPCLSRLRKKLNDAGSQCGIEHAQGSGYRLLPFKKAPNSRA